MENDYKIPASFFEVLPELFDCCKCGCRPYLSITVHPEGYVLFSVWCPSCDRQLNFSPSTFDGSCDFGSLAIRWNNPDVFKE